jgi:hypothetical protein
LTCAPTPVETYLAPENPSTESCERGFLQSFREQMRGIRYLLGQRQSSLFTPLDRSSISITSLMMQSMYLVMEGMLVLLRHGALSSYCALPWLTCLDAVAGYVYGAPVSRMGRLTQTWPHSQGILHTSGVLSPRLAKGS